MESQMNQKECAGVIVLARGNAGVLDFFLRGVWYTTPAIANLRSREDSLTSTRRYYVYMIEQWVEVSRDLGT